MKKLIKALSLSLIITAIGFSLSACGLQKTKTYTLYSIAFDVPEDWNVDFITDNLIFVDAGDELISINYENFFVNDVDDIYFSDEKAFLEYFGIPYGFKITSKEKYIVNGLDAIEYHLEYLGSTPEDSIYYYSIFAVEANAGVITIQYTGDTAKPLHEKGFTSIIKSVRIA